ncbi:MAG TPA: DUF418 domain-containing protein [Telluria sp.]
MERERIAALDAIRGLAVLGILAVNAEAFGGPIEALHDMAAWPFAHEGATALSYWIVDVFFREKFITLFSMLFGVSVFLVGGERGDAVKSRLLRRRLAVLFALAMLHGFGVWWGDILSLYAATGAIMFFCRSWRPRTLMITGLAVFGAMTALLLPFGAVDAASEPDKSADVAAAIATATASWAGAYEVNVRSYVQMLGSYPWALLPTLSLMMIGLALFKSGFLAGRSTTRRYQAVLGAGAMALVVQAVVSWQEVILLQPTAGSDVASGVLAPVIALGYAAGVILLLRSRVAPMLAPLAAAGRMAFTNYLAQSLIMTTLFYGGRFALMGQVDRPALWVIVIAVWVVQLAWSTRWLARFDYGPCEWAWRCLTLGRLVPFTRRPAQTV